MNQDTIQDNLSTEQNEVWENVKKYTSLIMQNDVKKFLKYFHKDYTGWNYKAFLPVKKTDIKNELLHLPKRKIIEYEIFPLSIQVVNKTAIVHYIYSAKYSDTNGKEKEKNGRNTDILIKQQNKWMIVADHIDAATYIENSIRRNKNEESIP